MESVLVGKSESSKAHVVFIPFPFQSHIKCMLKLARLLHDKGLQITFVNTEYNHKRLLNSGGPNCLDGAPGFQFQTIPDGVFIPCDDDSSSKVDADAPQDVGALVTSLLNNCVGPFIELVGRLESPVTCILSDGFMPFTVDAAERLAVPVFSFWTVAASAFMGFYQAPTLLEKELIPLKDESCLTNGYLDTILSEIPGLEAFTLKDLPGYVRSTDPNDISYKYIMECIKASHKASNIIIHTFKELETTIIKALEPMIPHVYVIGPLELLVNNIANEEETKKLDISGYSLWKEEVECLKWMESKEPNSVAYVNFGSTTTMSLQELLEFGWGLANSNHYFLWVIRPNMVVGDSLVLPLELQEIVKERGFIANWCNQEEVLNHPAVGGFLSHCGWGSTIESLAAGKPMMCWPFMYDQLTNCRQICKEWEIGMQIGTNVKRDEIEKLTRELIGGESGKRMRRNAMEWKTKMELATSPSGSSTLNLEKLVNDINTGPRI